MVTEHGSGTGNRQELTSREKRIRAILSEVFAPHHLEITDDSASHAGHAGAAPEGETHFTITIRSAFFEGQTRVARQRAIMTALSDEFDSGLHALSIRAEI